MQRAFGLVIVMIQDVNILFNQRVTTIADQVICFSSSKGPPFKDGHAMLDPGRFWPVSCFGRQGKEISWATTLSELTSFQVLFAYHLEALVPTTPGSAHASQTPQRIGQDVHFFSIGVLQERTLVIYMKKKGV